ncbi:hypothetical protein BJF85_22150 [Saccharomonospora sp. CUA-673]|nr:hypothetical protein BJF85_22150 [Saccharomonospora sp. CUA-673]
MLIVADDVTGAADTAVQFAGAGRPAELRLRPGASDARVVAVSTDSRACSDVDAAARVRAAIADTPAARVFKKIDSTVRGPIRAEIDAALDALAQVAGPDVVAVVCPAFPGVGRTIADGTLSVDGTPVAETSVGRDPVTPVTSSHVPTLLGAPGLRLDPADGPAEHAAQLRKAGRVVVVDAETDADLDRIALAIDELGDRALPVGAAGLAGALARLRGSSAATEKPDPTPSSDVDGPALVVVTSLHSASRSQVRALADAGAAHHEPAPEAMLDDDAWETFAATLSTNPDAEVVVLSAPERQADGPESVPPPVVAQRLADAAARLVRTTSPAGLVVTGGDGARAVLERLDGIGIRLSTGDAEVGPGVAVGSVVGGASHGLAVATKAGGFGEPDVLIRAARAVRGRRSTR